MRHINKWCIVWRGPMVCFFSNFSFVFIHLVLFIFAGPFSNRLSRPLLSTSTTVGIVTIFSAFLSSRSVPAALQVGRVWPGTS